jgi:hypothetical protein
MKTLDTDRAGDGTPAVEPIDGSRCIAAEAMGIGLAAAKEP